ncbi:MAG TPA: aldo/keto reductase [Nitrospinota bacterium]|jgi:aryl-alcohol dehydrogenase-like predicted oxidoreductase|nr:aldo/keto reductase [Nitrospinota bacterium]HJP13135.1 aldo/keto reductase [Nitrospinota bacterium]
MQYRSLGRTGIRVSEIGFGTGGISRLMVSDDHEGQLRAVKGALDLGVTFFDTAMGYGNGKSEANLGRALKAAGAGVEAGVSLSTKIRLGPDDLSDLKGAVIASVERSLDRLGRTSVDLIQIHNYIAPGGKWPVGVALDEGDVFGPGGVLAGFKELRARGKVGFFGFTGIGDPKALSGLVESGEFHTVQTYFNLLNPSSGYPVPESFGALDYGGLLDRAVDEGMGVLVIRVLALGALTAEPGLLGFLDEAPPVLSLGSEYARDVERAGKLSWLADEGGYTLAQAAIRFALMKEGVSTVLVGFSGSGQLEEAVSCSGAGMISGESMQKLKRLWETDFS